MKYLVVLGMLFAGQFDQFSVAGTIPPIIYTASIGNHAQMVVFGSASDTDNQSGTYANGSGQLTSKVDLDVFSGFVKSYIDVNVGGGGATINYDLQHVVEATSQRGWSFAASSQSVNIGVWAPVGDTLEISTSLNLDSNGVHVWRDTWSSTSRPPMIATPEPFRGVARTEISGSLVHEGVTYGQLFDVWAGGYLNPRSSTDIKQGPRIAGGFQALTGSVTVNAVNRSRGTASLLFREACGLPGWDHIGLNLNGSVLESHPGYASGNYWDPESGGTVPIETIDGFQEQHTRGSFLWDSTDPKATHITETNEIEIPYDLGLRMADILRGFGPIDYPDNPKGTMEILAWTDPDNQKGGNGTYTCVGMLEGAAEAAGHNNGNGFVPNDVESIGGVIGTLSPSLVGWFAGAEESANNAQNALQGWFDPVDFILTDPQGRQLGYTESLGEVNDIPGAFYTGNHDTEQFLILNPIPGLYELDVYGINSDESIAAIGDLLGSEVFQGVVREGDKVTLSYLVTIPEPTSLTLAALICGSVICCKKRVFTF